MVHRLTRIIAALSKLLIDLIKLVGGKHSKEGQLAEDIES